MRLTTAIIPGLLLVATTATAAPPRTGSGTAATPTPPPRAGARPPLEVVVEFGWITPHGDLGDDFIAAPLGFGAVDGLEAGFRTRLRLSRTFSLAPAFHFADYGEVAGTDALAGDYYLKGTTYRYTLEAMLCAAGRRTSLRPFLAAAAGLYRNRAEGSMKDLAGTFDESVNTFGWSVRAGIAVAQVELSAVYHVNRFATWRYFRTGTEQDYAWDAFVLRGAWVIPFGD